VIEFLKTLQILPQGGFVIDRGRERSNETLAAQRIARAPRADIDRERGGVTPARPAIEWQLSRAVPDGLGPWAGELRARLTPEELSALVGPMIEVARAPNRLVILESPSALYRVSTGFWPLVVLLSFFGAGDVSFEAPVLVALFGVGLLGVLALSWGWKTTAHRFDRSAGTLVILESGLVRASRQRDVSFNAVAEVVERRSATERTVELVLADSSTLVVVRTRPGSGALEGVARELSELLRKPLSIPSGSLIADRFEIERLIAQGGMGVVYRALDRSSGERVALKLALAPIEDPDLRARFEREMDLLAALDHPRVVRYVSHGNVADGRAFLAMQWLAGEDLHAALARGPLSLEDSLRVLKGAAEAIGAVHARGIIHRDLKPANLFLRDAESEGLVLLDFGIARHIDSSTRLTGSRAIVGTPHYMAPEQAAGTSELLPAADIFALGCIFYECLTGTPPFDAPQLVGVLARILFDNPEPVDTRRGAVPGAWTNLVSRMLAKEPSQRPRDGAALLEQLVSLPAANAELGPSATPEAVAQPGDSGDQVLVSVVLATGVDARPGSAEPLERFASIRRALRHFHCPIERLADGSLLATVLPQHSAVDQARIAASCALLLRDLLPEARISVATGRAALGRSLRVGHAVDRAVLLLSPAAAAGEIRLDTVTSGLVEGRFLVSERDGSVVLVGQKQDLDESRPLLGKPTPCVGRELELVQLEGLISSAADEGVPKAAVVLGPPGIGKSRLRHELSRRLRERHPASLELTGFGDLLTAGSPYVLVADALRRHAGIRAGDDPSRARAAIVERLCQHIDAVQVRRVSEFLGELCGVTFPADGSPPLQAARGDHRVMSEQIQMAFGDWVAAECRVHPVAFVLEDVQWADALSLKLLEAVLRELQHAPIAVLALGRPEAEAIFPKLLSGQRTLTLSLGVLSQKASELLVREVLGPQVTLDALERIVQLAAGNALFLEELIRAAAAGKGSDVPETVLAVLQARLSQLSPEARLALRSASVFGERFWQAGVARIAANWGAAQDPSKSFDELIDIELVERARTSRLPGEVEYRFRHALVCEAAYGLLAASDRQAGHGTAGRWLEAKGETDAVVLARHADESGDRDRAVLFYARAAEQSLGQYDFGEALARASKGVACGAEGQTLGILQSVQSSALYSMGKWLEAAEVGLSALLLLPPGSTWWCATVEKLMQVLPNTGQLTQSRQLADQLLVIEPAPDARAAYIRAVHTQLLGYAISADHERGRLSLAFIDRLGTDVSEPDVPARGYARLWRSVIGSILGDDMSLALLLSEQAIRDLSESQVLYRLSLAHIVNSFIWWGFGELERSERAAREARAIARQIHDDYHAALGGWYLSVALAESAEPDKLREAEECAWSMVLSGENPLFESVARCVTARVALSRGDWARAEADATQSLAGLLSMPPYALMSAAYLVQALGGQGRWEEACDAARQGLARLDGLEGPICTEVLFRAAAAEALLEGQYLTEGEAVLARALEQIELRASKITDPALEAAYLTRRYENRRVAELARRFGRQSSRVLPTGAF
jgi:eukaryotic-like serine/threonine-protein kinase